MNFELSEEQRRAQEGAREFAQRALAPHADDVDRLEEIDVASIVLLAKSGFFGLTIPDTHGGTGEDLVTLALTLEELAAECANTAAFVAANIVAARAILAHARDAQKGELLRGLVTGKTTMAIASFDPDEPSAKVLEARRQDDGTYELRGETRLVTLFGQPEHVVVFARVAHEEPSAFVVPSGAENLRADVLPSSLGKRAASLATLHFDGVRVPETSVLGQTGAGLALARSVLADERIVDAAQALGIARAAYEKAVQHVKNNLPKTNEPGLLGVQVLLADMCVEIEGARLLVLRAARQADAGADAAAERSIAKLFATEMATRVAHKALQILGARHVATTPSVERNFRDARMSELSDDSLEQQRAVIARTMLKA